MSQNQVHSCVCANVRRPLSPVHSHTIENCDQQSNRDGAVAKKLSYRWHFIRPFSISCVTIAMTSTSYCQSILQNEMKDCGTGPCVAMYALFLLYLQCQLCRVRRGKLRCMLEMEVAMSSGQKHGD